MSGPRAPRRRPGLLPALVGASLLGGCLLSPVEDGPVPLRLGLTLPPAPDTPISGALSPWDEDGNFLLGEVSAGKYPMLARVGLMISDYEQVAATWPDPEAGFGAGQGSGGEVQITLDVDTDVAYTVKALGWYLQPGGERRWTVYREKGVRQLALVAGQDEEVDVQLVEHETGSLKVSVRCQGSAIATWFPVSLSLVDAQARVVYPVRKLGGAYGVYTVTITDVPVGRPHWVRVYLQDAMKERKAVDNGTTLLQVSERGDTASATLSIPCR